MRAQASANAAHAGAESSVDQETHVRAVCGGGSTERLGARAGCPLTSVVSSSDLAVPGRVLTSAPLHFRTPSSHDAALGRALTWRGMTGDGNALSGSSSGTDVFVPSGSHFFVSPCLSRQTACGDTALPVPKSSARSSLPDPGASCSNLLGLSTHPATPTVQTVDSEAEEGEWSAFLCEHTSFIGSGNTVRVQGTVCGSTRKQYC